MRGRAYRRRQYAKRKRFWYQRDLADLIEDNGYTSSTTYLWGGNEVSGEERAWRASGFLANTPGWCSCWCCSDHRRRDGIQTRQEQRSSDSLGQQLRDLQDDEGRTKDRQDDATGVKGDLRERKTRR